MLSGGTGLIPSKVDGLSSIICGPTVFPVTFAVMKKVFRHFDGEKQCGFKSSILGVSEVVLCVH